MKLSTFIAVAGGAVLGAFGTVITIMNFVSSAQQDSWAPREYETALRSISDRVIAA